MSKESAGYDENRAPSRTRREALKRGAIVGGSTLWVVPAIQSIGMSAASAAVASGPGGILFGPGDGMTL